MDIVTIQNLIGSLGFPIVACGYMMYTNTKTIKEMTGAISKLETAINKLISNQSDTDIQLPVLDDTNE